MMFDVDGYQEGIAYRGVWEIVVAVLNRVAIFHRSFKDNVRVGTIIGIVSDFEVIKNFVFL